MKALKNFLASQLTALIVLFVVIVVGLLAFFSTPNEDGTRTFDGKAPTYSATQEAAVCEAKASNDAAIAGLAGVDVPQDASSGCEPTDLPQMGSLVYYDVDVSTPAAFYNAVNGKGFNEGYGLQCVAGFKEFMFALSGKYVATSTGGASGYASQQRQIEPLGFTWVGGSVGLQDGDWGIFGGGQYGHVAMRYQGKWFGQNQGAANASAGNAFNLMNISNANVIGYYRPNIYKQVAPTPARETPAPSTGAPSTGSPTSYTVRRGDTLGRISLDLGWFTGTNGLYGNDGYAQRVADHNGITSRGLIYPNQVVRRP